MWSHEDTQKIFDITVLFLWHRPETLRMMVLTKRVIILISLSSHPHQHHHHDDDAFLRNMSFPKIQSFHKNRPPKKKPCVISSSLFSLSCWWAIMILMLLFGRREIEPFLPNNNIVTAFDVSCCCLSRPSSSLSTGGANRLFLTPITTNHEKKSNRNKHHHPTRLLDVLNDVVEDREDPSIRSSTTMKQPFHNGDDDDNEQQQPTTTTNTFGMKRSFDNFDYLAHWYPVIWARDLRPNQPTKVTLFDTDYVVARITNKNQSGGKKKKNNKKTKNDIINDQDEIIIAMLDQCPHKSAALSEGRITAKGTIQCAYHGWSYNGTTGQCMEIPQLVGLDSLGDSTTSSSSANNNNNNAFSSARICGTAIPAMMQQGMVYLCPAGTLEQALTAIPPPIIPEMDDYPKFKTNLQICDMPMDWPLLLENILDADHGLFVHGLSSFDWYSASTQVPLTVEETFLQDGKGWTMTAQVDAVEKILAVDKLRRRQKRTNNNNKSNNNKSNSNNKSKPSIITNDTTTVLSATTLFHAPTFALTGRRSKTTGETTNLIGFWVSPVGTGRSRLLTAFVVNSPISVPRWLTSILFNNFLDQDNYLLVTQHQHVLQREADFVKQSLLQEGGDAALLPASFNNRVRKSLYRYRSPTERASARVGNLWDATLHRAPNRIATLLAMDRRGDLRTTPSREQVLDRDKYHLQACPDSQDVVKNCRTIRNSANVVLGVVMALKVYTSLAMKIHQGASASTTTPVSWLVRNVHQIPNAVIGSTLALSALTSYLADKVRRQFFFTYDRQHHEQDLKNIPKKVWLD
jgi:phenylpropionate dioxygenase-like ring-hydroxylating dioxygenase large terminal subunit